MKKLLITILTLLSLNTTAQNTKVVVKAAGGLTNITGLVTAGTNVTVTGNGTTVSPYVVNSSGGGGASAKAYTPLLVRNDSVYQKFNVLAYGAKGDSTQDETPFIQAAINAASAAGGGEVYFPKGVYLISGALNAISKSQLYIPRTVGSSTYRNYVMLKGEVRPGNDITGYGLVGDNNIVQATTGVRLISTATTGATGGVSAAVLGTDTTGFNAMSLSVENMAFIVDHNPSGTGPVVGGINASYLQGLFIDHVYVGIDTPGYNSVYPANNVVGIEAPNEGGGQGYTISNSQIVGFRSGVRFGEHVILNNTNVLCNYYGFDIKQGFHASVGLRTGAYWNAYDIYVRGELVLSNFKMDTEWQQIGKWYDNIATIKDTANLATGNVFYTIVAASVGVDNTKFIKTGGSNLSTATDEDGIATKISPLTITGTTNSYIIADALGATGQSALFLSRQGNTKWQVGNRFGLGVDDFYVYDQVNTKPIIYGYNGALNLGGTATAAGTSAIAISAANVIRFPSYTAGVLSSNSTGVISNGDVPETIQIASALTTSGAYLSVKNNLNHTSQFFKTNSTYSYKTAGASDLFFYNDGNAGDIFFLNDYTSGKIKFSAGSSSTPHLTINSNGSLTAHTYTAGTATFDGSGNITSSSDRRIKNNIKDFKYGLAEVLKLRPRTFRYNADSSNTDMSGFIAQEVQQVIPGAVHEAKDKQGTLSLETNAILAAAINAIQELSAEIDTLKKEIKLLKHK